MQALDWTILIGTLVFIVSYGAWKTRKNKDITDYIKGGSDSKWWTIGLSVMATQASAITFLSTPGQAFHDGMGFIQLYIGLPIAMIVICMVFIPIYHKLKVYTAYEYLETRFDLKTRTLAAILFLVQRGLAAGITIFAPSIILSAVLGWNLIMLNFIIGTLVAIYTVLGGTKAVSITQKQQMGIIFAGLFITFYLIISYLPEDITFTKALDIAGASGKMQILDFSFDFKNRYTFWSGIIGGTFLALSYFGTDQSQVQRYLSGKTVKESQIGLIFNGLLKVPMQFFILLIGIMVFVFYQFNNSPLHFNPSAEKAVMESPYAEEYQNLQEKQNKIFDQRKTHIADFIKNENPETRLAITIDNAADHKVREDAKKLLNQAKLNVETNDKDYVFIHFILNNLPRGLIGLLLAVILSAAMSSTAAELNALGTITAIDLYRRNKKGKTPKHYVNATKGFTLLWGAIAIAVACVAPLFDNLIQLVNIIGSIFYGNILGIFLLAFFVKYVKSTAVFVSAIITQIVIIALWYYDVMPYLWLNIVGCALVMQLSINMQILMPSKAKQLK